MFCSRPDAVALLGGIQVTKRHGRVAEAEAGRRLWAQRDRPRRGGAGILDSPGVLSSSSGRKMLLRALLSALRCVAHLSLQHQVVVLKLSVSALLGCEGLNCSSYAN